MSDSTGAYAKPSFAYDQGNLADLAPFLLLLMMRNVTSDGFRVEDPINPGVFSLPGCVIAAPSYPANTVNLDQDYIFNWVRDAAITAIEIAASDLPAFAGGVNPLVDYVNFAATCRLNAQPTPGHACFSVDGRSRPWTEQSDGPALQTLAILACYDQLDPPAKTLASELVSKNLAYLLGADPAAVEVSVYQSTTTNLWEEHAGFSFFARAVQLRCFQAIAANTLGLAVPPTLIPAIAWLQSALASHWNGKFYVSLLQPGSNPPSSVVPGYDANIDIVSACIYGGIPCTDTQLLATAALLRTQWADAQQTSTYYPINGADLARGIGPLLGRYPADVYNGEVNNPNTGDHPWALCTANFAELHYRLANEIDRSGKIPYETISAPFFSQLGITATAKPAEVVAALRSAADKMLRAIIFHSDHYELSEQFDGVTGYERSVRNLTWSYAAFLSALRARKS